MSHKSGCIDIGTFVEPSCKYVSFVVPLSVELFVMGMNADQRKDHLRIFGVLLEKIISMSEALGDSMNSSPGIRGDDER